MTVQTVHSCSYSDTGLFFVFFVFVINDLSTENAIAKQRFNDEYGKLRTEQLQPITEILVQ